MSSLHNKVAIIGRPNVGKSTLFNRMTGTRRALVKNEAGVTRDIRVGTGVWLDRKFEVLDTGGLTDASDIFSQMIKQQVLNVLSTVDCVVIVTDGRVGVCPEDKDVVRLVQRSGKPYIVAVNKIDKPENLDIQSLEFYSLSDNIIGCAFEKRMGLSEISEWVVSQLNETEVEVPHADINLAIIGKPNAGKSSLCNQILGEEKMLVTEIAGTTTDSVDSYFQYNDNNYRLIDTAGIRRRAIRKKNGLEMLSAIQSEKSISRADIVLLVVDALEGPAEQDARLLDKIIESHKGVILVVNKSDLGESEMEAFRKKLRSDVKNKFHFFTDIPVCFTSAKTGSGIKKLFETIEDLWKKLNFRVSTSELNDFFIKVIRQAPSPVAGTKNVKFYYATQTKQKPPSFIAFANRPEGVNNAYRRFLVNRIKSQWDLDGVPVRVFAMKNNGAPL